jgi:hypothetical protein
MLVRVYAGSMYRRRSAGALAVAGMLYPRT